MNFEKFHVKIGAIVHSILQADTYFGPSSRLSRSDPPRFNSRDEFCSWFGVPATDVADAGFGAPRLRDVDDVFKEVDDDDFSDGVTSFDGVDARESLSLPDASGFFGFFGTVHSVQEKTLFFLLKC